MATDERLAHNAERVEHEAEIGEAIAAGTGSLGAADALDALEKARVPSGLIYSLADMMVDPHYIARRLFEQLRVGWDEMTGDN